MAEEKIKKEPKEQKQKHQKEEDLLESLVRIHGRDIPGNKKVYPGLKHIRGVSWTISNAICRILGIDKKMRIS